jgi:gag-polypeptide of LTR copia-type
LFPTPSDTERRISKKTLLFCTSHSAEQLAACQTKAPAPIGVDAHPNELSEQPELNPPEFTEMAPPDTPDDVTLMISNLKKELERQKKEFEITKNTFEEQIAAKSKVIEANKALTTTETKDLQALNIELQAEKKKTETLQRKLKSKTAEATNLLSQQELLEKALLESETTLKAAAELTQQEQNAHQPSTGAKTSSNVPLTRSEASTVPGTLELIMNSFQQLLLNQNRLLMSSQPKSLIHPSSSNIANVTGVLGNEKDVYTKWYPKLEAFLRIQRVWVDPDIPFVTLSEEQKACSQQAFTLMILCVTDNSYEEIKSLNNSVDALQALRKLHDPPTATSRIEAQNRAYTTIYREGCDMNEHIAKLQQAFADLARHDSPSTAQQKVDQLVNSLPPTMHTMKSVYSSWPIQQYTFENVAASLRENYARDELSKSQHNYGETTSFIAKSSAISRLGDYVTDHGRRISPKRYQSFQRDSSSNSRNGSSRHPDRHDDRSTCRDSGHRSRDSSRGRVRTSSRNRSSSREPHKYRSSENFDRVSRDRRRSHSRDTSRDRKSRRSKSPEFDNREKNSLSVTVVKNYTVTNFAATSGYSVKFHAAKTGNKRYKLNSKKSKGRQQLHKNMKRHKNMKSRQMIPKTINRINQPLRSPAKAMLEANVQSRQLTSKINSRVDQSWISPASTVLEANAAKLKSAVFKIHPTTNNEVPACNSSPEANVRTYKKTGEKKSFEVPLHQAGHLGKGHSTFIRANGTPHCGYPDEATHRKSTSAPLEFTKHFQPSQIFEILNYLSFSS